jgi:hypothetical protein
MAAAFLGVPLKYRHVAMRAFAVLRQLPVPQRVALLAAGNEVSGVDKAGGLVAESAPGRLAAFIYLTIRAIRRYVAVLPAVEAFHSNSGFRILRALYQLPSEQTFIYPTRQQLLAPFGP